MSNFSCICRLMTIVVLWLVCNQTALADDTLHLDTHKAEMLHFETPFDTVFIADPKIADYKVINNQQLIVYGKGTGNTSLLVTNAKGKTIKQYTLIVAPNLASLQEQIKLRFPESEIKLTHLGSQFVISGSVSSEAMSQQIYELTGQLLGKRATEEKVTWRDAAGNNGQPISFLTRLTYEGVVNNLRVNTVRQVNVKLTIAEVSHSFIRQLGVKFGSLLGEDSSANFIGNGQFFNRLSHHLNSTSIGRFISAADDDAMGQILAQPNLSVLSGETASFLAGGEMPVVTSSFHGSQNVNYKEFGVRLTLAAKVHNDMTINLTLEPEVSSIDVSRGSNKLELPAFKTRRTHTTIQLADGESFVLGGLISAEDRDALSKIPFVGDIPILGAAFRHTNNQRQKTELIIVATVNLVKPEQGSTIQLPRMKRVNSLLHYFNLDSFNLESFHLESVNPNNLDPNNIEYQQRITTEANNKARTILATGGFKL